MKRDEIIKLYLSDLNNIVPQSPARDNRIAMLEKELASQPEAVVTPSNDDIEAWAGITAIANSIPSYKWGLVEGAKWLKSQSKQGYTPEFVEWSINHKDLLIKFGTIEKLHEYWLTEIKTK